MTQNHDGTLAIDRYDVAGVFADTLHYDADANLIGRDLTLNDGTDLSFAYKDGVATQATCAGADGTATFVGGVGGVLGSALGALIGGNSLEGRILGSTVVGSLGASLATDLATSGAFKDALSAIGLDGLTRLDGGFGQALASLGVAGSTGIAR